MIRILGNVIDNTKTIFSGLISIYGIGFSRAAKILKELNIKANKRVCTLSDKDIETIKLFIEKHFDPLEGELKAIKKRDIDRIINIGSYRGKRLNSGLPSRGQRTRTNSRTARKLSK